MHRGDGRRETKNLKKGKIERACKVFKEYVGRKNKNKKRKGKKKKSKNKRKKHEKEVRDIG